MEDTDEHIFYRCPGQSFEKCLKLIIQKVRQICLRDTQKNMFFPMRHAYVVTFDNGLRALQNRDFVDMKKERGEKTILFSSYSLLLIFSPCIDCI